MVSSISNSFNNNLINLKHSNPIEFKSILTMPNSHEFKSVPLIDLTDPNASSLIKHACEKWRVFQVINHGVPLNLLDDVELQIHRLFSLPDDRKRSVLRPPGSKTGYAQPPILSFATKKMLSENFAMIGSPIEHAAQLWPQQKDQQTSFCTMMDQFQEEMKNLSARIVELAVGSLGLTVEDINWLKPKPGCNKAQFLCQLNKYPVCPDPDQVLGLVPHTDSSLVTVLLQSNCSGFQVHKDEIGWVTLQPIPGALMVVVGDLMQILTNGRFESALHQVFVNKTRPRVSTAFFYGPPKGVKISPSIKLTDRDHPPLYFPVTWNEFLDIKKSAGFKNAIECVKIENKVVFTPAK